MIKKLLFIATIFAAGISSAQTFQLMDHNDVDITGTNHTENGSPSYISETKFHVKNTTGATATYTCDVQELSNTTTSHLQVCYGASCFVANHGVVPVQVIGGSATVAAGAIDATFKVAPFSLMWGNGDNTTWRVKIYNTQNPADSASAIVTWTVSGVSVTELTSNNIELSAYPNPTSNDLNIKYDIDGNVNNAKLEVFDVVGQKVKSYKLMNNTDQLKVNVSDLNAGVYFYTIKVDNKTLRTERVIVK